MEVDELNEDALLNESPSMANVESPLSDILDSDGDDDGINVTIRNIQELPAEKRKLLLEQLQKQQTQEQQQKQSQQQLHLLNEETPKKKTDYQGLTGAARKQYNKWVKKGMDKDEAMAKILRQPTASTPKRQRDSNDANRSGEGTTKKPKGPSVNERMNNAQSKEPLQQTGNPTTETQQKQNPLFSEVAKWIKVCIVSKDYPRIQLTTPQMNDVQSEILRKVVQQRTEDFKPKFTNCWVKGGYLEMTCQNPETANWLTTVVPTLKLWKGANLKVVNPEDIPRPDTLVGFFPQSVDEDNDTIRAFIESQNDGYNTEHWKVYKRNILFDRHVEWTFTVDDESMEKIKASNFVVNYKFGQTTIRKKIPKSKSKNTKQEGKEAETVEPAQVQLFCENAGGAVLDETKNQNKQNVPVSSKTNIHSWHSTVSGGNEKGTQKHIDSVSKGAAIQGPSMNQNEPTIPEPAIAPEPILKPSKLQPISHQSSGSSMNQNKQQQNNSSQHNAGSSMNQQKQLNKNNTNQNI